MGERFLTRGFIAFSAALVAAIWIPSAFAGNVRGDFDGDGYADLAIGAPWEDLGFQEDAGVVTVLYGSAEGLSATDSQRWNQNVRGIQDEAEIGDWFGRDLAAGDFDGDGFSDLAVGVPGENLRYDPACDDATFPCDDVGAVAVLYGSNTGLTARDQFWTQASPGVADRLGEFEHFGRSLAAANFGNGRRADLAIGVSEDVGAGDDAGAVHVLYGASGGLSTKGSQFWHQNRPGIVGRAESLDHFGWSLAAADFGKSAHADLAVGVFNEDLPGAGGAGAVAVLYGGSDGLSAAGDQLWHQDSPGIDDEPEFQDFFGEVLSAANLARAPMRISPSAFPTRISEHRRARVSYTSSTGLPRASPRPAPSSGPRIPTESRTRWKSTTASAMLSPPPTSETGPMRILQSASL